jgi:hypothetical protein
MLKYVNNLLQPFRSCFSRQGTFEWFVVLVVGFMLRSDHLGGDSGSIAEWPLLRDAHSLLPFVWLDQLVAAAEVSSGRASACAVVGG